MSSHQMDYKELMDFLWKLTDPEIELDPAHMMALNDAGRPAVLIAAMRSNLRAWELLLNDDQNPKHTELFKRRLHDTVKKLRKNVARFISEYAMYLDDTSDCQCEECLKAMAQWN